MKRLLTTAFVWLLMYEGHTVGAYQSMFDCSDANHKLFFGRGNCIYK